MQIRTENERKGWEWYYWDGPRLPAVWINCVLACGAGGSNSRRGGFIPLGAAWSSAGVLDLVIRLWGRATQRKSPLNSEEALKACSSLHQNRRKKHKKKKLRCRLRYCWPTSRSFDLNPASHCETSDWTIYDRADALCTGLIVFLPWVSFVSACLHFTFFLAPWTSLFSSALLD